MIDPANIPTPSSDSSEGRAFALWCSSSQEHYISRSDVNIWLIGSKIIAADEELGRKVFSAIFDQCNSGGGSGLSPLAWANRYTAGSVSPTGVNLIARLLLSNAEWLELDKRVSPRHIAWRKEVAEDQRRQVELQERIAIAEARVDEQFRELETSESIDTIRKSIAEMTEEFNRLHTKLSR